MPPETLLRENDDTFGKDSRLDWTAPADGDYSIEVRDLPDMADQPTSTT